MIMVSGHCMTVKTLLPVPRQHKPVRAAAGAVQISGFSSFTSLTLLSMAGNRLGEGASFEMSSLAALLTTDDSEAVAGALEATPRRHQAVVMFPLLQILRLQENSIRSIQGLQLFGFTGLQLAPLHSIWQMQAPVSSTVLVAHIELDLMPPLQVFEVWTYTETS